MHNAALVRAYPGHSTQGISIVEIGNGFLVTMPMFRMEPKIPTFAPFGSNMSLDQMDHVFQRQAEIYMKTAEKDPLLEKIKEKNQEQQAPPPPASGNSTAPVWN